MSFPMHENAEPKSSAIPYRQVAKIFWNFRKSYLIVFLILTGLGFLAYQFLIPFQATGTIRVNDTATNSYQAFSQSIYGIGIGKGGHENKKADTYSAKIVEVLKSTEFFEKLSQRLFQRASEDNIPVTDKAGAVLFKKSFKNFKEMNEDEKVSFMQKLDSWSKFSLTRESVIVINFMLEDRDLTVFLTNTAIETVIDTLKEKEYKDLEKVEDFLDREIAENDKNSESLKKQLSEMQKEGQNTIQLLSKEKMAEYLADLRVRTNEALFKISENKQLIAYYSKGRPKQGFDTLYGIGGKIEALRLENRLLESKVKQNQRAMHKVENEMKPLPALEQSVSDLKKKSELAFNRYKELLSLQTRVVAQKESVNSHFEIIEMASPKEAQALLSLRLLLAVCLFLALVGVTLYIYLSFLANPDELMKSE